MRHSHKLLGIVLASVLCGAALGIIPAPTAHAQSSRPAPGAGCTWVTKDNAGKTFSYGGISGYHFSVDLFADYSTTTNLTCHHMYVYDQLFTPAGGYGTTLWVYLNDCSGNTMLSASTSVNHGINGYSTRLWTGSHYQDCGQAEGVDVNNGIWMVDLPTANKHV